MSEAVQESRDGGGRRARAGRLARRRGSFRSAALAGGLAGRRGLLGYAAVAADALAVRAIYLEQVRSMPLFTTLVGDAESYDRWARTLRLGDWIGREVFYQAPLYPYFLGVLYTVFGRDLFAVRLVQIALGSAACLLLARAGEVLWNRRVGLTAGLLLALYPTAVFFDGLIQKSVLDTLLSCWLLLLLGLLIREPRGRRWFLGGLALGLLALVRENALVLLGVLLLWLWLHHRERTRRVRLLWTVWLVVGAAAALGPVTLRNAIVGGELDLTTAQLGPNFYIGNHPGADGTYAPLRWGRGTPLHEREDATALAEQAAGRSLSPAEVSRYWADQAFHYIRSRPLDWLRLLARKALLVVNRAELADTEGQALYADWSPLLRVLGRALHFGLLFPLAALGLALTWSDRRRLWPLYLLIAAYAGSVVAFYVFARYRLPLVPMLLLLASAGIWKVRELAGRGSRRMRIATTIRAAAAVAVAAVAANLSLGSGGDDRATSLFSLGNALIEQGRYADAVARFDDVLRLRPGFAPAVEGKGRALAKLDRVGEAIVQVQEALRLRPGYVEAELDLGDLQLRAGEPEKARAAYARAIELDPASADARFRIGYLEASLGRQEEAIAAYLEAIRIQPNFPGAHFNLANVYRARGQGELAVQNYQEELEAHPLHLDARNNLGLAYLDRGEIEKAVAQFETILRVDPDHAQALYNLGICRYRQGKVDAARECFERVLRIAPGNAQARAALERVKRSAAKP